MQQCANPGCIEVCPTGASYRDEETGIVPVGAAAADPDEALREDIRSALEEGEPASAVAKRLSQKYSRRKRDVYAMVLDMQ